MNEFTSASAAPRIELRVRHAVQPPVQDRINEIREELEALAASEHIAALDIEIWGSRIDLEPASSGTAQLDTYIEFAEWAATNDYELGPAFRLHQPGSMISSEEYPVVTVPLVTIVVFDDDELVAVYPHSTDEGVRTVEDALQDLSAETATPSTSRTIPHSPG